MNPLLQLNNQWMDVRPWMQTPQAVMSQALQQYPFINRTNPAVVASDKSETWPAGEEGSEDYKRPQELPLNRAGIEVPPSNTPQDIAGEVLHVDPYANSIRNQMQASWSPSQLDYLKKEALDYGQDGPVVDYEPPANRLRNATDSAIRGATVNQWPAQAVQNMNYNPQQMNLLNLLQQYMRTGTQGF